MKTILAGSRVINDYRLLEQAIELSGFEITEVVSGMARGVDRLGERWAREHDIPIKRFPANWEKYGKSAGYRRNDEMVRYAQAVILVWDGVSCGTYHTYLLARYKKMPVFVLFTDGHTEHYS